MKKGVFLLLCAIMLAVGCAAPDPMADMYTQDLLPGNNDNYSVGSNASPYYEGHFTNLWVGNITGNISGYVPYTGATQNLSLGTYNLSTGNTTVSKLVLSMPVVEDIRIVPGSFDRPGTSDPAYIAYNPNGGTITTYLTEWKVNDIASFTVQMPHSYAIGTNISVHVHWTAGARGIAENGRTVGWKVDYTWANLDGTFGNMSTADLSDACDGTNHKHQMTNEVKINGSGKGISSMLICNIKRTDTGTDDTWVTNTAGNLPMLLEADFHFEVDTLGSYSPTEK